MSRRSLIPLLAAVLALPASAAAQQYSTLAGAARSERGDTLVLALDLAGEPAVHVSEPFHLKDRVRLHVDINQARTTLDSAGLARLQGGNLLALAPHARAGGIALRVDLRQLADYRVVQNDSVLELHLLARRPAPAVVAAATVTPVTKSARTLPGAPLLALSASVPAAMLLLLLHLGRRRRSPRSRPVTMAGAAHAQPQPQTSPDASRVRADGRLWAVRTLAASGASTADVVRRTGMPRDAIRFLEADSPAVSAASGSNYRPETTYSPSNTRR